MTVFAASASEKADDADKAGEKEAVPAGDGSPATFQYLYTADGLEDYMGEVSRNKKEKIQTNEVEGWPQGPAVGAAGAVVMDADSGAVLYGKNMYMQLYPASITKVMTALLAVENLRPTDTVTFSENAVYGIEPGSSHIGMDVGESITVEQALYGLMIASANEVAIALGERVSGTESDFVALMNDRARELGCCNTHFVTTNGLHDDDHYTCAYDMALIAKEAYSHPELVEYMSQQNYHFEATDSQPDDFWIGNTNDFLTGEISCDDVVGGKTGYTDEARETLVTLAERDGKRLVCVIMREEPPFQYYNTIDLLDYAFNNFHKVNIAENETGYALQSPRFLASSIDIFGKSSPAYRIEEGADLMIPNDVSFADLSSAIVPYTGTVPPDVVSADVVSTDRTSTGNESREEMSGTNSTDEGQDSPTIFSYETLPDGSLALAQVRYQYHGHDLGSAHVLFHPAEKLSPGQGEQEQDSSDIGRTSSDGPASPDAENPDAANAESSFSEEVHGLKSAVFGLVHAGAHGSIYLNILLFIPLLLAVSTALCVFFFLHAAFTQMKRRRMRKKRRARKPGQRARQSRP